MDRETKSPGSSSGRKRVKNGHNLNSAESPGGNRLWAIIDYGFKLDSATRVIGILVITFCSELGLMQGFRLRVDTSKLYNFCLIRFTQIPYQKVAKLYETQGLCLVLPKIHRFHSIELFLYYTSTRTPFSCTLSSFGALGLSSSLFTRCLESICGFSFALRFGISGRFFLGFSGLVSPAFLTTFSPLQSCLFTF